MVPTETIGLRHIPMRVPFNSGIKCYFAVLEAFPPTKDPRCPGNSASATRARPNLASLPGAPGLSCRNHQGKVPPPGMANGDLAAEPRLAVRFRRFSEAGKPTSRWICAKNHDGRAPVLAGSVFDWAVMISIRRARSFSHWGADCWSLATVAVVCRRHWLSARHDPDPVHLCTLTAPVTGGGPRVVVMAPDMGSCGQPMRS